MKSYFFLREVQEHLHEFEFQGRDDERNYKGMSITITQNKNLTNESDWHSRIAAGNKPVENRHGSNFQDELQILQPEGKTFECIQAVRSINSTTSDLRLKRTRSSAPAFLIYMRVLLCTLQYWHKTRKHRGENLTNGLSVP